MAAGIWSTKHHIHGHNQVRTEVVSLISQCLDNRVGLSIVTKHKSGAYFRINPRTEPQLIYIGEYLDAQVWKEILEQQFKNCW